MQRNVLWLERYCDHPRLFAALLGVLTLAGLFAVHALTQFQPGLRPLYIIPIWLSTRLGGRAIGLFMVAAVTLTVEASLFSVQGIALEVDWLEIWLRFGSYGAIMLLIGHIEETLQKNASLARQDTLTGLLNRRAMREFAEDLFDRAKKENMPLVAVVIDCDDFKQLNDRYGHDAGDQVLQMLATVLENETRGTDLVSRIGGDEFVLIMPDTTIDMARNALRRIVRFYTQLVTDAGFRSSLSIGVAIVEPNVQSLDELIKMADEDMYLRKSERKSTVFMH